MPSDWRSPASAIATLATRPGWLVTASPSPSRAEAGSNVVRETPAGDTLTEGRGTPHDVATSGARVHIHMPGPGRSGQLFFSVQSSRLVAISALRSD
jgi:hypothetical protein